MAEEIKNPCTDIPTSETAIIDIPFNGAHVRFEGLSNRQLVCLMALAECYQLKQLESVRKSTLTFNHP